jgi:uncharacterized membrane protein YqhA
MDAPRPEREPSPSPANGQSPQPLRQPLGRTLESTRYVVLLAIVSVLVVAILVFLLGTLLTIGSIWSALQLVGTGALGGHEPVLTMLNLVVLMLEAVVFYIVRIGLYSLFIAPLRLTRRLGLNTFDDLESKLVSLIVVMIAVVFLENFVLAKAPTDALLYGAAVALVVPPLVWFKMHLH